MALSHCLRGDDTASEANFDASAEGPEHQDQTPVLAVLGAEEAEARHQEGWRCEGAGGVQVDRPGLQRVQSNRFHGFERRPALSHGPPYPAGALSSLAAKSLD